MEARAIIRANGDTDASGVATSIPWSSFTKTALSVALLRLSQDGEIKLDKTVARKPFTPAQLLRHEAGLPDYGSLAAYHADVEAGRPLWTVDALMEAAEADRLRYEPGDGWAYSNIGYWQVARLIEQASNQPLADALADLVFAPAELSTARLATTPDDLVNVSMGDAPSYHPGWVYHGLIVGTAWMRRGFSAGCSEVQQSKNARSQECSTAGRFRSFAPSDIPILPTAWGSCCERRARETIQ